MRTEYGCDVVCARRAMAVCALLGAEMTPTAVRITWLLADPEAREAYATRRLTSGDPLELQCLRCGGRVSMAGTGQRAGLVASVRDRGTDWCNKEDVAIHRGCIPRAGEEPKRLRARSLQASQVRSAT
jgi:hypothetical protein